MRNHDFDAFWRGNGRGRYGGAKESRLWDLKTRPKSWPTGWILWVNRYLENLFSKISGLTEELPIAAKSQKKKVWITFH